jgi:hypothetical protein
VARFFCVLIIAAVCAAAQIVEGTVTNAATGGTIAGAKVTLQQGEKAAYSVRYSADRYFYPGGPRDAATIQIGASGVPVRIEGRMIPLRGVSGRVVDTVDGAFLQRATRLSVRAGETTQADVSLSTVR